MSGYRQWHAGGRAAVALHCSLAHAGAWSGLAAALPQLALTAPDLPGHGHAPPLAPGQDLHDAAVAIGLVAIAQAGPPVDLIGHSFGGTVALRIALEWPALVRSLTLIEPVLFSILRGSAAYDAFAQGYGAVDAAMDADPAGAAALFHGVWGQGAFDRLPALQRRYMSDRMPLVRAQNPVLLDDRPGLVTPGRLEVLALPVLLIEGAESPPVIAGIQQALATRLPQVRRVVVPGAAHMVPITHPGEVAGAMADFLRTA